MTTFFPAQLCENRGPSFRTWGAEQAEHYISELPRFIEQLLKQPNSPRIRRAPVEFATPVYFARFRHHYIFFKWSSSGSQPLLILSTLHERMDLSSRLQEALNQI